MAMDVRIAERDLKHLLRSNPNKNKFEWGKNWYAVDSSYCTVHSPAVCSHSPDSVRDLCRPTP